MKSSHTLIVEEDKTTGDLYITFPPDVLKELKWDINTELEWTQLDDKRWSLHKVDMIPPT